MRFLSGANLRRRQPSFELNGRSGHPCYVYDFQGARAQKSTNGPASTTIYIGNIYEVTDGAPTEHIFAGNRRIAQKTGSSTTYYHPDHLGGLNIATNGSETVSQTVFYYPYGETRVNTGSVDLHYKFTGKEIDRERSDISLGGCDV